MLGRGGKRGEREQPACGSQGSRDLAHSMHCLFPSRDKPAFTLGHVCKSFTTHVPRIVTTCFDASPGNVRLRSRCSPADHQVTIRR
jgi:hypothetical protein